MNAISTQPAKETTATLEGAVEEEILFLGGS
jgi:hypothetical protein